LALSYYAAFDAAAKIDFTRVIIVRGKADRKLLFGLYWLQKLNRPDRSKLIVFVPIMQRCANFIENQHARHERRLWKMSRQAGMIRGNRAAHFKGHVSEVFLMPAAPATQTAILYKIAA
jgi:hypothetical protein